MSRALSRSRFTHDSSRRTVLRLAALPAVLIALSGCVQGEGSAQPEEGEDLETLTLDYAYYNPASLVLRDQGWLEDELADEGIEVSWELSTGSNKANELLRADAVQFGSTAGVASLLARANGSPQQIVDVLAQPEWTALVVGKDSTAQSVADLKGSTIAATSGTDPYFFLLQQLDAAGLSAADVEIVNLQHPEGRTALANGDVDAWAGLDPHMAAAELEDGARLLARDVTLNSYSVLSANEDFIADNGDTLEVVLAQYERARQWLQDNPDEAVTLLATESDLDPAVAERQLTERTTVDIDPVPGDVQRELFAGITPILVAEGLVRSQEEVDEALDTLFAPEPITAVIAGEE